MNLMADGMATGAVKPTQYNKKVTVGGRTSSLQVYSIRLDALYFNDQNDRIATWISEYKTENNGEAPSSLEGEVYNGVIENFIIQSNPEAIRLTTANMRLFGQREPGIVLADGRIVDGNRRFTCLRTLAEEDFKFGWFEAVILPEIDAADEKQIKILELMIQHGEEGKIDYNPIDRLVGVYNDLVEGSTISVREYAQSINSTVSEVESIKDQAALLAEFLESIHAPKQFYLARDLEISESLAEVPVILKKNNFEEGEAELKRALFANILVSPANDITRFLKKFRRIVTSEYAEEFIKAESKLVEQLETKLPKAAKITAQIITQEIRSDSDLASAFRQCVETYELKAKGKENLSLPISKIQGAFETLESIDINILRLATADDKNAVINYLEGISNTIKELQESLKG